MLGIVPLEPELNVLPLKHDEPSDFEVWNPVIADPFTDRRLLDAQPLGQLMGRQH